MMNWMWEGHQAAVLLSRLENAILTVTARLENNRKYTSMLS